MSKCFEIERRFLVKDLDAAFNQNTVSKKRRISQGYVSTRPNCVCRLRLVTTDHSEEAWITVKGLSKLGKREEYESRVAPIFAKSVLEYLCKEFVIEKDRYEFWCDDHYWVVDVFDGNLKGLIIAEVDLKSVDEPLVIPDWIGQEVTEDHRFSNSTLCEAQKIPL